MNTDNAMAYDISPRDAEGWKLHEDGSTRVHRYTCTVHDGQDCDGHCGPLPAADPVEEAPVPDVTIVSVGRLHDEGEGE